MEIFDFSKIKDQKKFEKLPKEEQEKVIGEIQEEARKIQEKMSKNSEGGISPQEIKENEDTESLLKNFDVNKYIEQMNFVSVDFMEQFKFTGNNYREKVKREGLEFAERQIRFEQPENPIEYYYVFKYLLPNLDLKKLKADDALGAFKKQVLKNYDFAPEGLKGHGYRPFFCFN